MCKAGLPPVDVKSVLPWLVREGALMAETRKLAAILAAEVAGYSKLPVPTRSGRLRGCARSAAI
jgi:hypothetical protein